VIAPDQVIALFVVAVALIAVVGITNLKSFLIFAAVLPQFVNAGAGPAQLQMFLLCRD
jgi:threonine/homoserine/homoserine lactone efflux protein